MEKVWSFKTERFEVSLSIGQEYGYQYDGEDHDGETQRKLDSGEFVAFDSLVTVKLDGIAIGSDSLGGSVYEASRVSEFWTDHRSPDPMHRNCSIMRAKNGGNMCVGHYFPDMVRTAIEEARKRIVYTQHVHLRKTA